MTTLFVATTGGHLAQLTALSKRLPVDDDAVWVTHGNEQSRSLLAGRDVEFVPVPRPGSVAGVARIVPKARDLHLRRRITRAYSTGAAVALAYLPYLAARGIPCYYIESATRVQGPSRTGQVLRRSPGVRTYTQYPHWANGRWRYGGSVLDGFRATPADRDLGNPVRVVVTVGTSTSYPFRRLFVHLAGLLGPQGRLARATNRSVEVLWQTGGTPVEDLPMHGIPFLPSGELDRAIAAADIIISHAGTGSALAILGQGRFPVVVPRNPRHGEAGDDHQKQLAGELVRRGLGIRAEATDLTVDQLLASARKAVATTDQAAAFSLEGEVPH